MYPEHSETRIDYLLTRVAEMASNPLKRTNLGQLALELLIEREKLEQIIESDSPEAEKQLAGEALRKLREVEKSIVRMHLFLMLSGKSSKDNFMNYIMSKYSHSGGIP